MRKLKNMNRSWIIRITITNIVVQLNIWIVLNIQNDRSIYDFMIH